MKYTVATLVLGLMLIPSMAFAATKPTNKDLQSQVNALMAQISALEARISALEGPKVKATAVVATSTPNELLEITCSTNAKFDKNNKVKKECKQFQKKK